MIRFTVIAAMAFAIAGCDQMSAPPPDTEQETSSAPTTEDEKTFYALGLAIAGSLSQFNMSEKELALVQSGLTDAVTGKDPAVDLATYQPRFAELSGRRQAAVAEETKLASAAYLAEMGAAPGAQSFDSGLVMIELVAGDGPEPAATDTVKVHYHGTLPDGTVFDSSVDRGEPATFPLNRVIKCWTEGVQKIKVGGKSRLICPSDIAYGDRGSPPKIMPGATLVFEVELLGIE